MPRCRRRTLTIRSARQVRALRTPLRQEIVRTLAGLGRASVRELGERMGRAPASLYYHVHELVSAGIVRPVGKQPSGNRLEAAYELVADRILLDRTQRSKPYLAALRDLHSSTLRAAERELDRAISAGSGRRVSPAGSVSLIRLTACLSPKQAERAREMMLELAEFLGQCDEPEPADAYALTAVLVPLSDRKVRGRT